MIKYISTFFLFTCSVFTLNADSPVTSTYFASFYSEYEIVNYAISAGKVDDKISEYLSNENNLIDVKAAVVNAIGWNYDGTSNAVVFRQYLARKNNMPADMLNAKNLTGSELMCLGYLQAMDDYFQVDAALEVLEDAKEKMPESFTVNMIYTIVQAQKEFDTNWCGVWQGMSRLLQQNGLRRDIKTSAIQSVVDYLIIYKPYCTVTETDY